MRGFALAFLRDVSLAGEGVEVPELLGYTEKSVVVDNYLKIYGRSSMVLVIGSWARCLRNSVIRNNQNCTMYGNF